jgi:hypothetical protein
MGDWCDRFATNYRENEREKLFCKARKKKLRFDEIEAPGIVLPT